MHSEKFNYEANPIILLNGISRSGKAVIWYAIGNIEGLDVPQNHPFADWIVDTLNSEEISRLASARLLALNFRIYSWYSFIGRNLNMKSIDNSFFMKLSNEGDLKKRDLRPDNNDSWIEFKKLWKSGDFIPCYTTDIERDLQNEIENYDLSFINMNCLRNPKKIFLEWCDTGRGSRYDELDRMGKFYFNFKDTNVPGFAFNYKDEWYKSSPQQRCFLAVRDYYDKILSQDLSNDINIFFEDFVQDPFKILSEISSALNKNIKDDWMQRLEIMQVPRVLDEKYLEDPKNHIDSLDTKQQDELNELEERYLKIKNGK
tara:strand:- start:3318 stop:4262 length:945 start_codon:yes stop_codon:yes gene_type:complete